MKHWTLIATLSALALLGGMSSAAASDRPEVTDVMKAFDEGDFERALELVELAVEGRDKSAPARELARLWYLAAEAHRHLGENAAAVEAFGKVLARRPRATPALVGLARAQAALKHDEEALVSLKKALAMDARDLEVRLAYGEFLTDKGKLDEAHAHLQEAGKISPGHVRLGRVLVEYHLRRNDVEKALHIAEAQTKSSPEHPMGHFLRGLVLERSKKRDMALLAYEAALALDDTFIDAHKNLAILCHTDNPTYADFERTRKSMKHYERYFALGGRDPQLHQYYRTTKRFVTKLLAADQKGTPYFRDPAQTAEQAALQFAIGIVTADIGQIERVVDWSRLYAEAKKDTKTTLTESKYRKKTLGAYRARLKTKGPRPLLEPALLGMKPKLTETELEDGRVRVVFPATLQGLTVVVADSGGIWRVVKLPEEPADTD